jgi:hypothetical protein
VAAVRRAVVQGSNEGAARGASLLRSRTPVDQGQARAAWSVVRAAGEELARIINDAPHIGIIEGGARPHPVGREGMEALRAWAWRHRASFGIVTKSGKAARGDAARAASDGIAWAIARKIKARGQRATYFVRDSMDDVRRLMVQAVAEAARRADVR